MNTKSILHILILCVLSMSLSCQTIIIETPNGPSKYRTSRDYSEGNLSDIYKKQLFDFDTNYIDQENIGSYHRFELVTPEQLQLVLNTSDKSLVIFWHKCSSTGLEFAQHMADSLEAKLTILSLDYELEALDQQLNSINYKSTVYIAKNIKPLTYKAKKQIRFAKYLIPETYKVLKDLVFGVSYIYFDETNPKNNFSTSRSRFIKAKPGYKKIKPENALEVYFSPLNS